MSTVNYFYAAYGLVWGAVLLYAGWIGTRVRALEQKLDKSHR